MSKLEFFSQEAFLFPNPIWRVKIENVDNFDYLKLRDVLYDILIYDMDIYDCIWYILQKLLVTNKILSLIHI